MLLTRVGLYYYKDTQEVDRITFDHLPRHARVFIYGESHVKTVSIIEGDLSLCWHVNVPSEVTVIVNKQDKHEDGSTFRVNMFGCFSFAVPEYDITKWCTKQYDLSFILTGYGCVIDRVGLYYYKDTQEVDIITFDHLPRHARVFIYGESHVKTVSIIEGDLSLCWHVNVPSEVTVIVNKQECVSSLQTHHPFHVGVYPRGENLYYAK